MVSLKFQYLSNREFEYVWVVKFFDVFILPLGGGHVPHSWFLGEGYIVKLPFSSDISCIRQENSDCSVSINMHSAEIQLILCFVIFLRLICE